MISLSLNSQSLQTDRGTTVQQLLEQHPPEGAYAIAVNGEFVPRSQYGEIALNDGDQIDIVSPVGGG